VSTFTGKIIAATSEPVNGAPVVVDIQTDHGVKAVPFERQLWNAFVDGHPNINEPGFRVEVWGEPWQQQIACTDEDCESCDDEL
jgi:hypothetical protein